MKAQMAELANSPEQADTCSCLDAGVKTNS